jgi:hypothetical protein
MRWILAGTDSTATDALPKSRTAHLGRLGTTARLQSTAGPPTRQSGNSQLRWSERVTRRAVRLSG